MDRGRRAPDGALIGVDHWKRNEIGKDGAGGGQAIGGSADEVGIDASKSWLLQLMWTPSLVPCRGTRFDSLKAGVFHQPLLPQKRCHLAPEGTRDRVVLGSWREGNGCWACTEILHAEDIALAQARRTRMIDAMHTLPHVLPACACAHSL